MMVSKFSKQGGKKIKVKKIKYLMFFGMALILAASLVAGACAPAAPTGDEGAEEIAKLEADLAAEKSKVKGLEDEVSDLEKEIAALKKPTEVHEWKPSTWLSAGIIWDDLMYLADIITEGSDGRIVVTPTAPGAICPVEEQVDNVAQGLAKAMDMWPGYYPGKVPLGGVEGGDMLPGFAEMAQLRDFWENYEDSRITELFREDYAEFGDIFWVGAHYWECPNMINSRVPIPNAAALEGMKFRSSEGIARALTLMGASTIWTPGPEIYTTLATGVVDACTFSHAYDTMSMGFMEVTDYLITWPTMCNHVTNCFVVNGTEWNSLTPDLQSLVFAAVNAASWRGCNEFVVMNEGAIKSAVDDYGITLQQWPAEDGAKYVAAMGEVLAEEKERSPRVAEFIDLYFQYLEEYGLD
jgi:TRAP-type mannitol/chloroaromatic compound transport system substrate-binding protein